MNIPICPKHEISLNFAILLFLALPLLSGCFETFNRETLSNQTIQVGDFQVEETIYHTGNWPDHTYERVYRTSHNGGGWIDLGDFENESNKSTGIVHSPIVLDDQLIIFSSSHVFLWRPGDEPVHFKPFEAEGWYEYSQKDQLNGHYDYLARDIWVNGNQTLLGYECDFCGIGKPEKLMFFSQDDGQTFDICLAPAPDHSICLD